MLVREAPSTKIMRKTKKRRPRKMPNLVQARL